jgi:aryl-alcohol dehydrogenase-like predicted oxidoreductase
VISMPYLTAVVNSARYWPNPGAILHWGVSEWSADHISAAMSLCRDAGYAAPVSNQPQYSALWRGIEERVLPTCA